MVLIKKIMNSKEAEIISKWIYPEPYAIYSFDGSQATVKEFIKEGYFSIYNGDDLIGFYCTGNSAQVPTDESSPIYKDNNYIDFGLGMMPELTGQGRGREFFSFISQCIKDEYPDKKLRLTVASFNKRAIRLYKNFGFKECFSFIKPTINHEFMIMKLD